MSRVLLNVPEIDRVAIRQSENIERLLVDCNSWLTLIYASMMRLNNPGDFLTGTLLVKYAFKTDPK